MPIHLENSPSDGEGGVRAKAAAGTQTAAGTAGEDEGRARMKVGRIRTESTGNGTRLTSIVGGEELYFEFPSPGFVTPANVADSFAVMALGPSMLTDTPLEVESGTMSSALLENLHQVQDIYHSWNPRCRKVGITAHVADPGPPVADVLTTWSAGTDSIHGVLKHRAQLTGAFMIAGFDMEPDPEQVAEAFARSRRVLEGWGLTLHPVITNQRLWGRRFGVYRPFLYSSYIAATALFFGVSRVYIPSAFPYGFPTYDGSQPYLDPLWSNGRTRIEQTGAEVHRSAKVRLLVEEGSALDALRVCFRSQNENCGRCGKCLRTMITLRVLGRQGPFPRVIGTDEIRRTEVKDEHDLYFAMDNAMCAAEMGDRETLRALQTAIRRYDRAQVIVHLDRWLFRGRLRAMRRKRRGYDDDRVRFLTRPDLDL